MDITLAFSNEMMETMTLLMGALTVRLREAGSARMEVLGTLMSVLNCEGMELIMVSMSEMMGTTIMGMDVMSFELLNFKILLSGFVQAVMKWLQTFVMNGVGMELEKRIRIFGIRGGIYLGFRKYLVMKVT